MKDGFDKSVAEKMPRMQKKRANRPWNVDPVQIKTQQDIDPPVAVKPVQASVAAEQPVGGVTDTAAQAIHTIEDIDTEFTQILFEKKDIQRKLRENHRVIEEVDRENSSLKESLSELEKAQEVKEELDKELSFLNEQLEDADFYIRNMLGLLDERQSSLESESSRRMALEGKFEKLSRDVQAKAKLDVRVSILEKDLSLRTGRIAELEALLEEESRKRKPLEDEITDLKNALDRVYSSLAHIRLKAKREAYGS
ncbi:MAG TPA: hypothetical protein ENN34_10190 [Deltaproteobacteria bacterium]|nr:hypothetical protein [Deltaproteobacteria bacterium]